MLIISYLNDILYLKRLNYDLIMYSCTKNNCSIHDVYT